MDKEKRGADVPVSGHAERENRDILQRKINEYSDMLYKLALLQLRNRQDAEDVVQETFYQLIRTKKEFESPEHEKAWLIRVTMNGCKRIWRSAWRRHTDPMPEREPAAEDSIEQETLKREQKRELLDAVMKLPRKYREVIHLFYFQELSVSDICLVMDRKESTVTSQLTRGRALLKKRLREEYRYE